METDGRLATAFHVDGSGGGVYSEGPLVDKSKDQPLPLVNIRTPANFDGSFSFFVKHLEYSVSSELINTVVFY